MQKLLESKAKICYNVCVEVNHQARFFCLKFDNSIASGIINSARFVYPQALWLTSTIDHLFRGTGRAIIFYLTNKITAGLAPKLARRPEKETRKLGSQVTGILPNYPYNVNNLSELPARHLIQTDLGIYIRAVGFRTPGGTTIIVTRCCKSTAAGGLFADSGDRPVPVTGGVESWQNIALGGAMQDAALYSAATNGTLTHSGATSISPSSLRFPRRSPSGPRRLLVIAARAAQWREVAAC